MVKVVRVAVLLGVLVVTSVARADDPHALTQRAKVAFDSGDFGTAASLLERAYALKPWPVLLYNLGRAYQQAGRRAQAVDAYERYLRSEPTSADAGAVRESIRQLNDQIARDRELESQTAAARDRLAREAEDARRAREAAREANERARHKASAWPWIVTGTGVGAVAAGSVLGALALSTHASAVAEPSASKAESQQGTAQSFALAANVLFVAGSAIAVAGLVWGIVDVRLSLSRKLEVSASPTTVALLVRF
ncbi:MAG TPA: tetratricopeptide repeat protein [Polyangiaceae bacterium]|jgi:tetratricopeptide (TPR) repeat protein